MNVGKEKEYLKREMVNTSKVKDVVNVTVMTQIMNMDFMHEIVSMHRFLSSYERCFVLAFVKLDHTAVWHCCMRLVIIMYQQSNVCQL